MTLIELVRAAYRDAVENGYDSVREIAYDLLECDAIIEATDASIEEVEAAVVIVVEENGAGATIPRQSRGLSRWEPLKAAEGDADASTVYWAAYRQPLSATDSFDPAADLPSPGS
jgi:hypothetical protein